MKKLAKEESGYYQKKTNTNTNTNTNTRPKRISKANNTNSPKKKEVKEKFWHKLTFQSNEVLLTKETGCEWEIYKIENFYYIKNSNGDHLSSNKSSVFLSNNTKDFMKWTIETENGYTFFLNYKKLFLSYNEERKLFVAERNNYSKWKLTKKKDAVNTFYISTFQKLQGTTLVPLVLEFDDVSVTETKEDLGLSPQMPPKVTQDPKKVEVTSSAPSIQSTGENSKKDSDPKNAPPQTPKDKCVIF